MEYVQERVATLHDLTGTVPDAPVDRTAVVVPMTEHDDATLATERTLSTLARHDPAAVVVPVRAPAARIPDMHDWLSGFDLPLTVLWCNAPAVDSLLAEAGVDGSPGKGRDVWLALGVAAEAAEYVVVHDADALTYGDRHVPRLVWPLANGYRFSKGYYARVEGGTLYGRLFRLFYAPLVRALRERHDAPILDYLGAFRYALAGEFGATAALAGRLSVPAGWGLEVATLGDAFRVAGVEGSAQVDLGRHEHDHRAVGGPGGLAEMAEQVGAALFAVVEEHGVAPDYDTLPDRYRRTAADMVDAYAADAGFNDLAFDATAESEQVAAYATAIGARAGATEIPAWRDVDLAPEDVRAAADPRDAE